MKVKTEVHTLAQKVFISVDHRQDQEAVNIECKQESNMAEWDVTVLSNILNSLPAGSFCHEIKENPNGSLSPSSGWQANEERILLSE